MRYLFILIVLLTLSCSKEKWQAPKGTDCSKYFDKNAVELASEKSDNLYNSKERHIFTGEPSVLLSNLVLKEDKLYLTNNLVNNKKVVCIKGNSGMGIKFSDGEIFAFVGKQKTNCKIIKDAFTDLGALGIYEIPLNSLFMKKILTATPTNIAYSLDTGSGFHTFRPVDEKEAVGLQNSFRCAFEALGGSYDLTDDSVLINNKISDSDLKKTKE